MNTHIRSNRTLQWEVRGINASNLCAPISARGTFKTGNFAPLSVGNVFEAGLKLYPTFLNPGEGLTIEGLETGEVSVQCQDLSGKKILSTTLYVENQSTYFTIGQWPTGVYLLQIKQGNQQAFRKIVVQP
jgi:hypothetical protein